MCEQLRSQVSQSIEGVVELLHRRSVGKPESQVVRCDYAIAGCEPRQQISKHVGTGRKSVQQNNSGRVTGACLSVEEVVAVDGGVAMMDHGQSILLAQFVEHVVCRTARSASHAAYWVISPTVPLGQHYAVSVGDAMYPRRRREPRPKPAALEAG